MAKKQVKSTKGKSKKASAPKHSVLPAGFWAQVGAVLLVAFSLFLILSWFGAGGSALVAIHKGLIGFMGWATFFLPAVLIFISVEIFRDEQNRFPSLNTFGFVLILFWLSGFFGLFRVSVGLSYGGWSGEISNKIMLAMVNSMVAAIIYLLLISITLLSILRVSPIVVIKKIGEMLRTNDFTIESKNAKVFEKAKESMLLKKVNDLTENEKPEIKLNAGVDILDEKARVKEKLKEKKGLALISKKEDREDKKEDLKKSEITIPTSNFDNSKWQAPDFSLLEHSQAPADAGDVEQNARTIKDTLSEFNIEVEMESANIGPRVTQYTLVPQSGVKLSRIENLSDNIALNLAAESIRVEAPIPGKRAVGVEIPNIKSADVRLFSVIDSKEWKNNHDPLTFAIGKDISGHPVVGNLAKMPHLLVAGQTGSGKSVMMNTLLTSLLYRHSPSELKLIMVDPKVVEMTAYEDIPHLLTPIINDSEKALSALRWAVNEMERRYRVVSSEKVKEIKSYNKHAIAKNEKIKKEAIEGEEPKLLEVMPYIVIVIDELADLMMAASKDVEAMIVRIAQKARAVGIHLVLATQKPVVSVVTGLIKGNVPSRIAFKVASNGDSRTILDRGGAEKLLGNGDMLFYMNGAPNLKRVQGAWVTDEEVLRVTNFIRSQGPPQYNDEVISQPTQTPSSMGGVVMNGGSSSTDETFETAVKLVIEARKASTSYLQRRLGIGYSRAAKLIDEMEDRGIVGPTNGSKPREVLISSYDEIGE